MSSAGAALRAAIHEGLSFDGAVTTLLGGAKIYDEPPKNVVFPYVTLGEARTTSLWSGGEPGEEHSLTLHAWSRQGGHSEAHRIAGAVMQALDDVSLDVAGHHVVNFRFTQRTSGARRMGAPITP